MKKKIYLAMFVFVMILVLSLSHCKEGLRLGETQCTQFHNCSDCTTKKTTSGNSCYWNPNPPKNEQSCGSFYGNGWLPYCKKKERY